MLQFTASWCSVCRTEMPFIEKEIWQEKKNAGLIVLGIDRDEPVEKVLKFKKDIGVTYPLALDPGADIFGLFAEKAAGVTRNVIIDRSGKIIFLTRLYERPEFDEMKKVIFNELAAK
jgi:peroxiredoxin